jgi:Alpha amylase, catalytic domain
MATMPRYPSLFQINTRVWLQRLSHQAGKKITLAHIDDATLDGFAEQGFDWIWLLSVWQTGATGRAVSRSNAQWRAEFQTILPDLTEEDICGSGFAITAYTVSDALGGEKAMAQFREKLARRDIKLLLDFVPNHTAPEPRLGKDPRRLLYRGQRRGAGERAAELPAGPDRPRTQDPGLWPRSEFSWLARYLAAQLRQPRPAGSASR